MHKFLKEIEFRALMCILGLTGIFIIMITPKQN